MFKINEDLALRKNTAHDVLHRGSTNHAYQLVMHTFSLVVLFRTRIELKWKEP